MRSFEPLAGFASARGMSLLVKVGDAVEEWAFSQEGYWRRRVPPPPQEGIFRGVRLALRVVGESLPQWGRVLALVSLLALLPFLWGSSGAKSSLGLLLGLGIAILSLRIDGVFGWHSLEHKAVHLLSQGVPEDEDGIREKLKELSPYHPDCGSLLALWGVLLAALANLFLPLPLALVLGFALGEVIVDRGYGRILMPLQALVLAKPSEEATEAVVKGLWALASSSE